MKQQERLALIASTFAEFKMCHKKRIVWRIDGERLFISEQPSSWWTYLCTVDVCLLVSASDLSEYIDFLMRTRPIIWFQHWKEDHITEHIFQEYYGNRIDRARTNTDEIRRWSYLLADATYH